MRNPTHKSLMQRVLREAVRATFVVWVPLALLTVTGLALAHWYALPQPALQNPVLLLALAAQRAAAPARTWRLTHVLYGACECSSRVLSHLQGRGVIPQSSEHVVFVGRDGAQRTATLRARNFHVSSIEPIELKTRYGLEVAPLLIIEAPDGDIRYLGGYTERKQGPVIRDREILTGLQRGEAEASLPVFGCAVSRALQDLLDPLKLKYDGEAN
jgi:hypothetical protein